MYITLYTQTKSNILFNMKDRRLIEQALKPLSRPDAQHKAKPKAGTIRNLFHIVLNMKYTIILAFLDIHNTIKKI